jgi:2-keto-3-deoxy-L-rhamnonate aldolase RhmA
MTFVAIPSVRHAQIIALTGLDGVIIDCEHGKFDHHLDNGVRTDMQDISVTTRCIIRFPPSHRLVYHLSFESEVPHPIY